MPLRLQRPNLPRAVYWFSILAFALRIVARLHTGIADFWVNGYTFFFDMAQSIAAGKGIAIEGVPTAFRVPLYPIFLAALTMGHKAFWPIAIAQSMIGAGTNILRCVACAPDVSRAGSSQSRNAGCRDDCGVPVLCCSRYRDAGDQPLYASDSCGSDAPEANSANGKADSWCVCRSPPWSGRVDTCDHCTLCPGGSPLARLAQAHSCGFGLRTFVGLDGCSMALAKLYSVPALRH